MPSHPPHGQEPLRCCAGLFFTGYALFQIPSNLLLVRVGAPTWLAGEMAIWGALSALQALIRTAPQFYIIRFLLGVAECGTFPGPLLPCSAILMEAQGEVVPCTRFQAAYRSLQEALPPGKEWVLHDLLPAGCGRAWHLPRCALLGGLGMRGF